MGNMEGYKLSAVRRENNVGNVPRRLAGRPEYLDLSSKVGTLVLHLNDYGSPVTRPCLAIKPDFYADTYRGGFLSQDRGKTGEEEYPNQDDEQKH